MKGNHIVVGATRAWLRKNYRGLTNIGMTASGPRISLSLSQSDEPKETRSGFYGDDTSPYYEMDRSRLRSYYYAYSDDYESKYDMLYAETVAFKSRGFNAIHPECVDIDDVDVTFEAAPYRLPPGLAIHGERAIDWFKQTGKLNYDDATGTWENNDSLRLWSFDPSGKMICQKASYFDQVATNLTLDWANGTLRDGGFTIRSSIERPRDGRLAPLNTRNGSCFANTLGTAIMFYDSNLIKMMVRTRNDQMASIPEQGLHCTVSGVLEVDPAKTPGKYGIDLFDYGTRLEIGHETGLSPDEYLLYPVAISRELPRGGKPQLFYVAILLVDDTRFEAACASAKEAREYVASPDGTYFNVDLPDKDIASAYTYEGWAAQVFAESFVAANEARIRQEVDECQP